MRVLLIGIVVMCVATLVLGGGCDVNGRKIKADEKFVSPGLCAQQTCHKDGSISAVGCPYIPVPPKCTEIPQDNSKTYPDCCSKIKC